MLGAPLIIYYNKNRGAHSVMFIVIGNGHGDSNPGWGCCISYHTNTLGKYINPTVLFLAMG